MTVLEARREALEAYLEKSLGLSGPCRIVDATRMAMGQSRAMYRLELEHPREDDAAKIGRDSIVLRVEQSGLLGSDGRDEVRIMRALHAAGYPVAKVLLDEPSDDLLGQPFFAMELAEGSSVFVRESLDEYVLAIDRLHHMDPAEAGLEFLPAPDGPRGAALLQVERWYDVYRRSLVGEPSPLVEEAAQWLRNNAPESERICVVHGDPGPGNYLHRDGALSCIVDWEFAHIGDPEEDWAYLVSMRGMGVMNEDAWLRYLHELIGIELDRKRLRYWQAFNFFKGACIDQTALKIYMDGRNRAPNLLAIGTAVHLSALKQLATAIAAA
jgi:aminoglycoside phosphotransferase (APT) family kinase protein